MLKFEKHVICVIGIQTIEIMSFVSANASNEAVQKFLEILQNDFRTLANETKKKYPQIKEVRIDANSADFGNASVSAIHIL